jgi:hypothetical protein
MSSLRLPDLQTPKQQVRRRWRGLGWAMLVALLGHVLLLFALAQQKFSFDFKNADSAAITSTMSTRWLEPAPTAIAPPPADRPPTLEPALGKAPALIKPIRQAERKPSPQIEVRTELKPELKTEQKSEPNEPVAANESTQAATETIASLAIFTTETASVGALITTTVASGGPAPPGMKLSYPPNTQLQFQGTYMSKGVAQNGSGLLSWKSDGNNYVLSLEATALVVFSRTEKSAGQMSAQGLAPQRYSSVRTGRSEQATHFRSDIGKIQFSSNKPDAVLLPGAQDRLSALVQLAGILGGDPERYKTGDLIHMQVAGLDSAEDWEFSLQGTSDITLPTANMQALKLSRSPRNEFDQRLEIWLSPQLGYLPIRIRQSSAVAPNEDYFDLLLRKLP